MTRDRKTVLRYITLILAIVFIVFMIGLFNYFEKDYESYFYNDAKLRESALGETVQDYLLSITILENFFKASEKVTEEDFQKFTKPYYSYQNSILVMDYVIKTENGYEVIHSQIDNGKNYVLNTEALKKIEFDDGAGFLMTDTNLLLNNDEKIYTIVSPLNYNDETGAYDGMVIVILHYEMIVGDALKYFADDQMEIYLTEKNDQGDNQVIYSVVKDFPLTTISEELLNLHYSFSLKVANRDWTVFLIPTASYRNINRSNADFQILIISCVLAAMLYTYLKKSFSDKDKLTAAVMEKTKKLRVSQEKLTMALEGAELGLWEWNMENNRIDVNDRFKEMTGYDYEGEESNLTNSLKLINEKDIRAVKEKLQMLLNGEIESFRSEHRIALSEREDIWVVNKVKVYEWDNDGIPTKATGTYLDVTEIISLKKKYESLATKDQLTGLYNRRYYFEEIQKNLYRYNRLQEPFTIAIVDIDYFKVINDTYGHPAGDYILQTFAQVLQHQIRNNDILARYGGEEFVFLLENTNKHQALAILDRIKDETLEYQYIFDGVEIEFTFSGGIADVTERSELEELIRLADERLYTAKEEGRNRLINM